MKKVLTFVLVALFTVSGVFAQTSWKSARHSINWGIGGNISETDVCPYDGFMPTFKTINGSAQFGYEYRLGERFSFRTNFLLSRLQGYDADADYGDFKWIYDEKKNPNGRRLNFRTWVFDINAMLNFFFIKPKDITRESSFGKKWAGYFTVGIGGAFYNPKFALRTSKNQNVWVNARPLEAEGRFYNTATWTLPYGLGFRYHVSKKFYWGVELLQHYCFTDYIDNVTSNSIISSKETGAVKQIQDRVKGNYADGKRRGGKNEHNDQYTTFMITFGHTFTPCGIKHVARPKYLN